MHRLRVLAEASWRIVRHLETRATTLLTNDVVTYGASALMAGLNLVVASGTDYRQWAAFATPGYVAALLVSLFVRRRVEDPLLAVRVRRVIVLGVFATVVLAPLATAVWDGALGLPGIHAQAEVAVIERCADRMVHGHDCYLSHPTTAGVPISSTTTMADASAFVPYLPAMGLFGLPNGLGLPAGLSDARLWMTGFAIAVLVAAAALARLGATERWRLFTLIVVLPSGALPMTTGGDDLPVVALLVAGLLLIETRPRSAGVAFGLALAMKLTAWPIVGLVLLSRDPLVHRRRVAVTALTLGLGVTALGAAWNPAAFITNELRFPLGLTAVRSPAQSPLLGQALVELFPSWHHVIVAGLLCVGVGLAGLMVWAAWPLSLDRAILLAAAVVALATILAPHTRFGYLLYSFDLVAVLVVRRPRRPVRAGRRRPARPSCVTSVVGSTSP